MAMRGRAVAIATLLWMSAPVMAEPAKDLLGSWRSNRELTAREMDKSTRVTREQRAILEPMFGELIFVYTESEATAFIDGTVSVTPYKVISQTSNSVVIEYFDEVEKAPRAARSSWWVIGCG